MSNPRNGPPIEVEGRTTPHQGDRPSTNITDNHNKPTAFIVAGQDDVSQFGGDLVVFDWRAAARLSETGLTDVDRALTFTGLAAEIRDLVAGGRR